MAPRGANPDAQTQLTADLRKGLEAFRRLLQAFDERKASNLFEATRERFVALPQGKNVAQLVVQLHFKHVEMAGEMVGALRRCHFATAATLSRTLLEGGVTLTWAIANGDAVEPSYDQLLRILAKGYQDQERQAARSKAPALTRPEQDVLNEATARGLAQMPHLAGRMLDLDKVWADLGSSTRASDHYQHYSVTSAYAHPSRLGLALFSTTPAGLGVFAQGQTLLGAAALYYGAIYFCVAYQCSSMLAGVSSQADWIAERRATMHPLLSRLVEHELE